MDVGNGFFPKLKDPYKKLVKHKFPHAQWHRGAVTIQMHLATLPPEHFQPPHNKNSTGCLGYIGDYTTQVYRDYKQTVIRIPINQAV